MCTTVCLGFVWHDQKQISPCICTWQSHLGHAPDGKAAVQDVLQWEQVHVIGLSMGAMVATQLASMHPEKFLSLTLISVTAGRWQAVPTNWAAIKYAWQVTHLPVT